MHLYKDGTDKQLDKIYLMSSVSLAGWQKLCGDTEGPRQKVWTQTKILSRNIRYFVVN